MAKTLLKILPLAAALIGMLAIPTVEARRGGGHGGHGGHGHGGHRFHGHHGHHGHRNHHRHHHRFGNRFFDGGFGGFGGYGDYYPSTAYNGEIPVIENMVPVAPATPVTKGYSTYYSADGYYNYPRFAVAAYAPTEIVVACCPKKKAPKRISKPKTCAPLSVAEKEGK